VVRYEKLEKMEHSIFDVEIITVKSLSMNFFTPLVKKICEWV
jgi:hypothetical protein